MLPSKITSCGGLGALTFFDNMAEDGRRRERGATGRWWTNGRAPRRNSINFDK